MYLNGFLLDKSFQRGLEKHQFKTKFKMIIIIKRAGKMAQQVKGLVTNPDDLCLTPGNHGAEGKN